MKTICILTVVFLQIITTFQSKAQNSGQFFTKNTIQIGIVVEDIEKAVDFYINVLGMVRYSEFRVNSEFAKRSGLNEGSPFDVTVLKLENSDEAQEWKVMSFGKKATHPKQEYTSDDTGMQHATIYVRSMKPFLERFKKYNVKLLGETPIMLDDNRQFVLIQDPEGNFFELVGPQ